MAWLTLVCLGYNVYRAVFLNQLFGSLAIAIESRLSGLEVLTALREEEELAETRVIVLTAQPATREQALGAGADIVMVKPFEPGQIAAAVEEVLADRA